MTGMVYLKPEKLRIAVSGPNDHKLGSRLKRDGFELIVEMLEHQLDRRDHGVHANRLAIRIFAGPVKPHRLENAPGEVFYGAHPTLPSRLIATSFCASTANSIGSFCMTSRTKPLTSRATASSSERPRCWA